MRAVWLLLSIYGCLAQHSAMRARRLGTEAHVIRTLETKLEKLDSNSRPPVRERSEHSAIVVVTSLFINQIEWKKSTAEVNLLLRQQWEDSRLGYDVGPNEGIHEVRLPADIDIWTPDTYISSGKEESSGGRKSVLVEPNGYVRQSELRVVEVAAPEAGVFSPTRTLTIRLTSYKYPLEDVVYLWANSPPLVVPVEVSSDLLSGSLQFEQAVAGDCVGNYTVGQYSCIDVLITFKGPLSSGLAGVFLPSTFLVVASWLHMFIHGAWSVPRTISAAVPFAIFAALFLFAPTIVYSSLCWFIVCLLLTFLSLLEYFVVIALGVQKPVAVRTEDGQTKLEAIESGTASRVDAIARIVLPVLFVIAAILLIFVFN